MGMREDPYIIFNFIVEFAKFIPKIQAGFSEITGLQGEMEVHQYREGGNNDYVHKLPGPVHYTSNLVLKKGLVDRYLWDWYTKMSLGISKSDRFSYRSDVTITLVHNNGGNQKWSFKQAYPVKWIGPQMNAKQSTIALETLELAHQGFMY